MKKKMKKVMKNHIIYSQSVKLDKLYGNEMR